jgi:hypothetical protein
LDLDDRVDKCQDLTLTKVYASYVKGQVLNYVYLGDQLHITEHPKDFIGTVLRGVIA